MRNIKLTQKNNSNIIQKVLLLNGTQTEGIFRVSADVDEVNYWKSRLGNEMLFCALLSFDH